MKKLNLLFGVSALAMLVGCGHTSDYTPAADASGEQIFSTACTECHTPVNADVAIVISARMTNKDAIIKKVQSGSMRMKAFPNIQGDAADRLAEYVLANSTIQ
ncbi:c-type cytochrome [Candidatus Nitrotoga sp. M5]|uniref:c-type cytochrome n=1 Tax=Candidatus Nitrotoga sp. M5 TaxID=2890409 RepID=UPI001EF35816|nr:cytochrome c [Candidatus Nitrotoga sp. M5]CAH1386828.1 Cytochrome c oxidase subunit CcoP [Candidatus Nitrotoga sp. M5]